jgi:PAS domain S-box-containing protein
VALDMAGRRWSLRFAATPAFDAATASRQPWMFLAGGLTISLLLFGITWSLTARARALALASGMTEALRDSETRTSAVVESTLDGIVTTDERGAILSFNLAAQNIFGYTSGEVIGSNVGMLMKENERSGKDGDIRHFLGGAASKVVGTRHHVSGRRRDGSEFPLELAVTEMRVGGQRQFIGLLRDISEQVRAERLLQEANALHEAILNSAAFSIIATDLDGAVRSINPAGYYQPQVDCRTRRMVGVEGLLRWRHPQRGVVLPNEFIDLAEETGLLVPIGEWVLWEACTFARNWKRETGGPLRVSVNLSPRQMFAPRALAESVERTLKQTGVEPECLGIEITENMLLQSAEETGAVLARLHGLGVQLAIDDFGTRYSNLAYLKRFPIDKLKIDRSFVRDLPGEADDTAIARTIIAMAHALKMRVVAEGVETLEQCEFLLARHREEAQGYYFRHPVPLEELPADPSASWTGAASPAPVLRA